MRSILLWLEVNLRWTSGCSLLKTKTNSKDSQILHDIRRLTQLGCSSGTHEQKQKQRGFVCVFSRCFTFFTGLFFTLSSFLFPFEVQHVVRLLWHSHGRRPHSRGRDLGRASVAPVRAYVRLCPRTQWPEFMITGWSDYPSKSGWFLEGCESLLLRPVLMMSQDVFSVVSLYRFLHLSLRRVLRHNTLMIEILFSPLWRMYRQKKGCFCHRNIKIVPLATFYIGTQEQNSSSSSSSSYLLVLSLFIRIMNFLWTELLDLQWT